MRRLYTWINFVTLCFFDLLGTYLEVLKRALLMFWYRHEWRAVRADRKQAWCDGVDRRAIDVEAGRGGVHVALDPMAADAHPGAGRRGAHRRVPHCLRFRDQLPYWTIHGWVFISFYGNRIEFLAPISLSIGPRMEFLAQMSCEKHQIQKNAVI